MIEKKASPFVKWAGGKRQLLSVINKKMPATYERYYEPFVGGGAVLFDLLPKEATINDINESLVNAYNQIKRNPKDFLKEVRKIDVGIIDGGKAYYYKVREFYNDKLMRAEYDLELAVMLVFLNKHCFNGLYRVNGKGLFNVPYNNSVSPSCTEESIYMVSEALENITIEKGDFENVCNMAKKGDFIFIDSPYAPLNSDSFESYTKEGFDVESHKRLANCFKEMTKRGCYCMLTNHNTEFINDLYEDFNKEVVDVKRMINSDAKNRVGKEIIITNY
ncbi:Dam family site-specific DNA-(adenine-N6)-methyltransferase [Lachnospiraceae bacterium OttesenSCG-928-J05]|nr:Dam family site-specific DNA-(adenine-N6)-methyltransferase [Lachnospiraceae bacterium OttesenSCG-928-J05]